MNILVIDVGTSSMRGILFGPGGEKLIEKQVKYHVMYKKNGWVEQNPKDWENALYKIINQIVQEAKECRRIIDAISITSQRSSVIAVDERIEPMNNAVMWQDKRASRICEERKRLNGKFFSMCGSRITPVFSGPKMTWIREKQPDIYEKIYKFMVIPDYLIYLMTGEICTDYTYGSRSLLMNIRTCQWEDELLDIFRVKRKHLCELVEPGCICGYVTKELSKKTGCPSGIPVITAGGDQQCGAIGQGVVKQGVLSVTIGTGGYLVTEVEEIPNNLQQDVICNLSSIKGRYILESNILAACSAFDWFRKEFLEEYSYDYINEQVEKIPLGANGCQCIPYFMGRTTPDWNDTVKGVFANITLGTTKYDMLRSLLEAICFEIRNGIDVMMKYSKILDVYINGGLANSETFNRMQADVYGMKLNKNGETDATARGALCIAATSMKGFSSVEDAYQELCKQNQISEYLPDGERMLAYEKYRMQMNNMYEKIF